MPGYVIITPAHNEEAFIEKTIESVINQTVRPAKWIIVNDSSTDRTCEIVERYVSHHDFIQLIKVKREAGRHFGNKVRAFNHGVAALLGSGYDYIGNLDADISIGSDYFEKILPEFDKDPKLGIAGGIVYTKIHNNFVTHDETLDSVGGAVQMFRRTCFEEIGGYLALPFGGIDAAAEITARMRGWKVRKFPENRVFEHRRTGTAVSGPLAARIKEGRRFYSLGYGFVFYLVRCLYRLKDRPFVLGSAAALLGYLDSMIRLRPVVLSREAVLYLRAEQRGKLRRTLGFPVRARIDA
jgi:poly-beta-1,6-N-acetyl-D-glucosamine synthase